MIKSEVEDKPLPAEAPKEVSSEEVVRPPLEEQPVRPSTVVPDELAMEDAVIEPDAEVRGPPVSDEVSLPPEEEEMAPSEAVDRESGRETVREILAKVRAAEARAAQEEVVGPPEEELEITEEEEEAPEETQAVAAHEMEAEAEESFEEEVVPEPTPVVHEEKPAPFAQVAKPMTSMAQTEPAKDEKIRLIESDIKAYTIEHQQLHSEYDKLKSRLDEEVGRYHVVAETKRTRAEGIERELRLAKKEHDDAKKEHKNAENRRKKELSEAEKRIGDVEKRIKKSQEAKDKRIEEIEKEKRRREEEAAKGL